MQHAPTIAFIQKTAGRGGAKNRLLDTLTTLKSATDCRLHVITGEQGEFTDRCAGLGVPVTIHRLPEWRKLMDRLGFSGAMNSLYRRLPFKTADWVISNEMWWAPHAAALAKKLQSKSAAILRDGVADAGKARKYRLQDNDLVFTHHAHDLNVDHRLVHQAVLTAFRPTPDSSVKAILCFEVASSTGWNSSSGPSFHPVFNVDISASFAAKLAALRCYDVEMRPSPHPRSAEMIEALARWRGSLSGLPLAEAFEVQRIVAGDLSILGTL